MPAIAPSALLALWLAAAAAPAGADTAEEHAQAGSHPSMPASSAPDALPAPLRADRRPYAALGRAAADAWLPQDSDRPALSARPSILSAARLVEMPAEVVPGRYTRPKYALGFRSSAMKSFANSLGLEAETCLMPLIRTRTSISQDGDISGRVMVFARCSFY